jgi:hypothetical protein
MEHRDTEVGEDAVGFVDPESAEGFAYAVERRVRENVGN